MLNNLSNIIKSFWALAFAIIVLLVIKIPHLSFPFSWDESYSYIPGILKMVETGPSIIPKGIHSIYHAKGHPLFYYFLSSGWISIFSDQIAIIRMFAITISVITLIVFYSFLKSAINQRAANFGVIILSVQSLFLAQSSLMLPEVLLTLLLILSLHFFIKKRYLFYALFGSLMILTKETGLVFLATISIIFLFENGIKLNSRKYILNTLVLSIPFFVYGLFLLLHYKTFGSFFFNEHLDYMTFDISELSRKFRSSSANLFFRYGRNLLFFTALFVSIYLVFKKKKWNNLRILVISLALIIGLLVFTVINFYSYRYILPAFPLFILISVLIIEELKYNRSFYPIIIYSFFIGLTFYKSMTKTTGKMDNDLSYVEYLPLHKQIVNYCESEDWDDKTFGCSSNLLMAMRDKVNGYLSSNKNYKVQHLPELKGAEIVILDSYRWGNEFEDELRKDFKLKKRFEFKNHWGEIYVRIE